MQPRRGSSVCQKRLRHEDNGKKKKTKAADEKALAVTMEKKRKGRFAGYRIYRRGREVIQAGEK